MSYEAESVEGAHEAGPAGVSTRGISPVSSAENEVAREPSRWAWSCALNEYDWMDSHSPSFDLE